MRPVRGVLVQCEGQVCRAWYDAAGGATVADCARQAGSRDQAWRCGQPDVKLAENNTHVFIVRIWREPQEPEDARCAWRGSVENVRDGQQRFVCDLDQIAAFVSGYLHEMGVDPRPRWWKAWWKRWSKPRVRA